MRHRAPHPFIDLWHCLPRATARLLAAWARPGHVRALVAVMVVLGLGTTAYVAGAPLMGGSSNSQYESAGLGQDIGPSDGEQQNLTQELPTSDGRTPNRSSTEPGTPGAKRLEALSRATGRTPRSGLAQATDSPSPEDATPSTTPEDITPPETSLTEEFPAVDAAQFSFSANESASFTCSLDGAAYTPCDSSARYSDLDPGWHTFAVRAMDAAGNVDPSPAETRWHARDGRSANR